ncbi:phage integrase N-terminal SAM-like domain-containing protein [Mesorhizobium sp. DCY119]|uniref:phage integrase N-terminal SAM-like domain-containing protein n=1 Tax=Mesorhizobium sp. DCY119 TaxID=2108445 RepID=UPI001FE0B990|nr:phage integrase N-terminal SAM-like domain-containing protein [Mesorhizobium sp. DCY119]
MIEDMRIRGMGDRAQEAHIRAIKDFAGFLRRSPALATPDDLRAYQLHMTNAGASPWMFNSRIVALGFFFGVTCGREEMKRHMQFQRKPRNLPVVLSVEEIAALMAAVPGPGLRCRSWCAECVRCASKCIPEPGKAAVHQDNTAGAGQN